MTINDLVKSDNTFSESAFLAKVDNTFTMLMTSIMLGNLERVSHKISEDLLKKYQDIVDRLNRNNERQMYDELNVKSTEINDISITDTKYIIKVLLVSRYMDYIIDKNTGNYKSGINNRRIEKNHYLTFEKMRNAKVEGVVRKCPSCGASVNANLSGKCEYCGSIYNTEDYDWVLTEMN